jgi:trans-aconitate 2-methyltransferase
LFGILVMSNSPTNDAWNPLQYDRFRSERAQPFFDLLAMVRRRDKMSVADLGCGTGELTRQMHQQLAAARTVGIDSSAKMLAGTDALAGDGLAFRRQDIADFANEEAPDRFDLIFSNAAIQWLDDHPGLLARLARRLDDDNGQLAIQMPANDDHVTHEAARIVARAAPFKDSIGGWQRAHRVAPPEEYATILFRLGFSRQHVRVQVYPHVLENRDQVIEWVRGTLLTDYQRRVPVELWEPFLAAYRAELFRHVPDERPFFYPFKRVLMWAQKS